MRHADRKRAHDESTASQLTYKPTCDLGEEAGTVAHTAQHFESVMQEKRNLEESLSRMREERQFVERCLTDARMDIGRLETENESVNSSFHQTQLAAAKLEGKLQAAQTRVSALENDVQKKKDEVQALNDELKRVRQNMMQSESEKVIANAYACTNGVVVTHTFCAF